MAQLTILRYPDPRLHTVARPVAAVDERIRRLVDDMLETMYAADGVGLAATQVDVHERVIVIDTSEHARPAAGADQPRDRSWRSERHGRWTKKAACRCRRSTTRCSAMRGSRCARSTATASPSSSSAEGLLAVCVQHEMDHLLGKVFVEYLSPLKRDRIRTQDAEAARARSGVNA